MNIIERERDVLGALPRALSLYLKQPLGIYLDNDSLISLYFKSKHLFRNFNLKKRSEAIGPFKDGTQKWLTSVETLEILWVELIFKFGLGSRSVSPTHSRLSERPLYTMRVIPRRFTILAPNGPKEKCVVRPLIKSVLIFWGEWLVTHGYSVAIALLLYKVWCISAPP